MPSAWASFARAAMPTDQRETPGSEAIGSSSRPLRLRSRTAARSGRPGDVYLSLEAAGWKGERGAAFANGAATRSFFHRMMAGAWATGRLEFLRLDLNGEAIAMLINFRTPPASWSYKIAYDERLSRFSPGVMIEIENLMRVLADPEIDWMDSCAVEDHPMINSLWAERRQIVQISVPLSGLKRRATYALCRAAEEASARVRAWRTPAGDPE
jgi:hypothetical protein